MVLGRLGSSSGSPSSVLGASWSVLGRLGVVLDSLGNVLGRLGSVWELPLEPKSEKRPVKEDM